MAKKKAVKIEISTDSKQGGRKYMEDEFRVKFSLTKDGEFNFAYFGLFDGHGGPHASEFAKKFLLDEIIQSKAFWSNDDIQVMKAIKDGFLSTHKSMTKAVVCAKRRLGLSPHDRSVPIFSFDNVYQAGSWPNTLKGHPSTSGCTASVVFITCDGKMYVGHVGDSGVLLGLRDYNDDSLKAHCITVDHKPGSPREKTRIENDGGHVWAKAGVQRVVWTRPKLNSNTGPIRRSSEIEHIPFLAVARSLGDLWSYNPEKDTYVVSPEPDICSFDLDTKKHKCIIIASDGLWNMVKPQEALDIIRPFLDNTNPSTVKNAATVLVETAINRWNDRGMRADNTTVLVVQLHDDLNMSSSVLQQEYEIASNTGQEPASTAQENSNEDVLKPVLEHSPFKHTNLMNFVLPIESRPNVQDNPMTPNLVCKPSFSPPVLEISCESSLENMKDHTNYEKERIYQSDCDQPEMDLKIGAEVEVQYTEPPSFSSKTLAFASNVDEGDDEYNMKPNQKLRSYWNTPIKKAPHELAHYRRQSAPVSMEVWGPGRGSLKMSHKRRLESRWKEEQSQHDAIKKASQHVIVYPNRPPDIVTKKTKTAIWYAPGYDLSQINQDKNENCEETDETTPRNEPVMYSKRAKTPIFYDPKFFSKYKTGANITEDDNDGYQDDYDEGDNEKAMDEETGEMHRNSSSSLFSSSGFLSHDILVQKMKRQSASNATCKVDHKNTCEHKFGENIEHTSSVSNVSPLEEPSVRHIENKHEGNGSTSKKRQVACNLTNHRHLRSKTNSKVLEISQTSLTLKAQNQTDLKKTVNERNAKGHAMGTEGALPSMWPQCVTDNSADNRQNIDCDVREARYRLTRLSQPRRSLRRQSAPTFCTNLAKKNSQNISPVTRASSKRKSITQLPLPTTKRQRSLSKCRKEKTSQPLNLTHRTRHAVKTLSSGLS